MPDVRCPVCNTLNPENQENCLVCGARLRVATEPLPPIRAGQEPTAKSTGELERTLPGWLRDLRSGEEGKPPAAKDEPDSAISASPESPQPAEDDLLAGLSGALFESEPAAESQPEAPADFLSGLMSAAGEEEEEAPDWLKALQGDLPQQPVAAETPPASAGAPADDFSALDWFAEPAGEAESPDGIIPEPTAPVEETSEEIADWLRSLDTQAPPASIESTSAPAQPAESFPTGDESPDWLTELGGEALPFEFVESSAAPGQPQPAADLSDWFAPAEETPASSQTAPAETPDWLSALGEEPSASSAPSASVETPDWLSALGEEPAAPFASVETPDWLSAPGEEQTPSASSAPSVPASAADETLDWLSALGEEPTPSASSTPAETPDWLSALGEEPAAPSASVQGPPTQPVPESALEDADWLATLGGTPAPQAEIPSFDAGDLPSWLSEPGTPATPPAEVPGWLTGDLPASETPAGEPMPAQETGFTLSAETQSAPAFLDDTLPGIPSADAFSMEMPDWLSGIAPLETAQPEQREEESLPDLSPAELPSWVQSMRPVESIISETAATEEGTLEQKGPLAGLRNVLPMPGVGLSIRKPPAYANKLELDESQQVGAALLESILAAEKAPSPVQMPQGVTSARVLRWLISLVMLLAVTVPAILNMQFAPSNDLLPPETLAAANQIGALPPGAAVLVVVDYEPGLSGEMEAAAAPVIDHLMVQGVRLAFVSTSPSGPLLAERLVGKFQSVHKYQPGTQYVNLGYLPGGPAGIAAFAAAPSSAIQFTVNSARAWETEALAGLETLDNFAAVLVVTDSVDTGRAWIEQAGPALARSPLIMAISAQAEPIIRPYYDAGQVKGLLTGLVGGAAYEQIMGKPGLGRQYWDSLSSGFLVAEIFIVIGSLWGIFAALRARRDQRQDDEVTA